MLIRRKTKALISLTPQAKAYIVVNILAVIHKRKQMDANILIVVFALENFVYICLILPLVFASPGTIKLGFKTLNAKT